MGWVQEIFDGLGKIFMYEKVYQYQRGIFLRNGKIIKKRKKLSGEDLEEVVEAERKVIEENRGMLRLMFPNLLAFNKKPKFPEGYRRSLVTGLPRHPNRYQMDRVIYPGGYLRIPFLDDIIKESVQERILNVESVDALTVDEKPENIYVSCNVRYEIRDVYRACIAVHDYEKSLKDHTLSILAMYVRGKKLNEWKDKEVITKLQEDVEIELRKIVSKKWGIDIHQVYVTNVTTKFNRIVYEGAVPTAILNLYPGPASSAE